MGKSLLMRTEASYSLNFMIYLQNIYLNQYISRKEDYKFPYTAPETIAFKKEYGLAYKELWDVIVSELSKRPENDMEMFHEKKDVFYRKLFIKSKEGLKQYHEFYIAFKTWWGSLAGSFSIDRSIDDPGRKVYVEFANLCFLCFTLKE
ncbi:hypothetical protein [Halobacillus naozhouensis]|uniref:Uncharacterized protein n=1 Tax=Halobacillus naozhouensis TaxID=554880 RepID=A0ABY8J550_9BACI|nr:hypothetical protein [Halobacillus naozhouensis]WFT76011.1 hypothetical protein P9989_06515 [Halobacillus naozhouensis]